ncbi:Ig-like domain repeat protein [Granulicella sp. dw_53]|uniref:NHL domain-containing protein n=1 Tax=Granulicella sp. dw_53 TaxID=2719792 RepID=UPI001BD396AC|nr:Ig-like domain repeat protein [Granulicella sp. dw_53]
MALSLVFVPLLYSQGILTVTPGRSISTTAGTGVLGYTGDNGNATAATLASPKSLAYDKAGNLFLADARNHVVREVLKSGVVITVAGSGVAGFSGDGGQATSAFLDTPIGVAVDGNGNLYIADSHNHRIRAVVNGTITTIAGTGVPNFSGDGGPATAATLALPSAVAVDVSGNLYIADTNNQRIRKISGTIITTIAGNGEESYAGDGGAATAASLDLPTGIAVDPAGKIYIADRHNQRVRMIASDGTISTVVGAGIVTFAGSFSGDGSAAASATLAKPSGVWVDAAGSLYIADTNNQRVRQVGGGSITTVSGTGEQGFGGDGSASTSAVLNAPNSGAADVLGNITIADTLNQRIRSGNLPILSFPVQTIGVASTPQTVTLSNAGSAPIIVSSIAFTGPFLASNTGTCSASPITLAAGASCTENVVFQPTAQGMTNGSVVFSGNGVVPQSVLLTGASSQSTTTISLTSSLTSTFAGQPVTFTATVRPIVAVTPTGAVSFYDGTLLIGSVQILSNGTAALTTSTLNSGTHSIKAVYAGDSNFSTSTSSAILQSIADFSFAETTPTAGQTVAPGQAATFAFTISPVAIAFNFPITLSATGLPPGATATFTPPTITLGTTATSFTMKIQTAASTALLHHGELFGAGTISLGLLLLPFTRRMRRSMRGLRPLLLGFGAILSFAAMAGISGCGSNSGYFGHPQQAYTINVIGTAANGNVTLVHTITVMLTVQ